MSNNNEEDVQTLCDKSIELFRQCDFDGVAELYTADTQFLAPSFSRIDSNEGVRIGQRHKTPLTIFLSTAKALFFFALTFSRFFPLAFLLPPRCIAFPITCHN